MAFDQANEKERRKEAEPNDRKDLLVEERHLRGHERHESSSRLDDRGTRVMTR